MMYCFDPNKKLPKLFNFMIDSIGRETLFFVATQEENLEELAMVMEKIIDKIIDNGFHVIKKNDIKFPIKMAKDYVKIYCEYIINKKKSYIISVCPSDYGMMITGIIKEEFEFEDSVKDEKQQEEIPTEKSETQERNVVTESEDQKVQYKTVSDVAEETMPEENPQNEEIIQDEVLVQENEIVNDLPPPEEMEPPEEAVSSDSNIQQEEVSLVDETPEIIQHEEVVEDSNQIEESTETHEESSEMVQENPGEINQEEPVVEEKKHEITVKVLDYYHEYSIKQGGVFKFEGRFKFEVLDKSTPQSNLSKTTKVLSSENEEDMNFFKQIINNEETKELFMITGFGEKTNMAEKISKGSIAVPLLFVDRVKCFVFENKTDENIPGLQKGRYVVRIPK